MGATMRWPKVAYARCGLEKALVSLLYSNAFVYLGRILSIRRPAGGHSMEELEVNHVAEIQEKLTGMVGDRVKVKANMGRTRVIERMGVIKGVHPAVFIIEVDERRGRKSRQSYQYVDVLTGTVELFDPETGEHIFTPLGTQLEEH